MIREEPSPVLEPLGTEVELHCRVDTSFRIEWIIFLPDSRDPARSNDAVIVASLATMHGIVTEASSAENREPPLRINGTIGNSGTTVQCEAINLAKPLAAARCRGTEVPVTFHGERQ